MNIGSILPKSQIPAGVGSVELVPAEACRLIRDGEQSLWAWERVSAGLSSAAQYAAGASGAACQACAMAKALRQTPNKRAVGPRKAPSRKRA